MRAQNRLDLLRKLMHLKGFHDRTAAVYARELLDNARRQGMVGLKFWLKITVLTGTWI